MVFPRMQYAELEPKADIVEECARAFFFVDVYDYDKDGYSM